MVLVLMSHIHINWWYSC